ncbi:MAG: translesion error-prone DNA polymerase V autoproteolytic subunit [Hydrotalea flava]|uniref:LexA family protein n=1 Tax=Hydrotalea TaxID=1004300 RepID=UPI000945C88D|nr:MULTISPECIES: translesion error-prone DNA polymerase V autoproteolytic subunit [Hydrotalea]NIM35088.1 translesion error-prone DNA polymerase V autoproteolytic subunit [Hydrotalea flava]NIM37914.1 translesion error-prone DNA polymerase V autoproteolytic subunit [Hydrotalea flava]NIN03083.1 translesion error-prone DNA polymerase V autoproteolytic subunit [Hydrotalea flava]NIN14768.1 translesion error-prone DNA polymerase V autoproteolytic subunit [Hydrotalea flava]NIO93840.1 translesion error
MIDNIAYTPAYRGSKDFTQHQVPTANANGLSAAADDYMERGIDLNEQLIMNKPATFFFRMNGDAMTEAGIHSGDVLIVDRSVAIASGKIIAAVVNGELLVRRLQLNFNHATLLAENSRYASIEITEFSEQYIWGVVTCVIHILEKGLLSGGTVGKTNSNNKKGIHY